MDKRSLLAISLSFLIFFGWQKLYLEPRTQRPVIQQQALSQVQNTSPAAPVTSPGVQSPGSTIVAPALPRRAAQTREFDTSNGKVIVSDGHTVIKDWTLTHFRQGLSAESTAIDLSQVTNKPGDLDLAFDHPKYSYLSEAQGAFVDADTWVYDDSNVRLSRTFKAFPDKPFLEVNLEMAFKAEAPKFAFVSVSTQGHEKDPEAQDRQLVFWKKDALERHLVSKDLELTELPSPVAYIGAATRYFLFAIISQAPLDPKALLQPMGVHHGRASLVYPISGNSLRIPLKVYFGPKEIMALRSVDPRLDHTIDFGWFTVFAYPLLRLLKWFYSVIQNYGIAIILLTLLVKLLTYPLTYKSMKSMKEMARMQPQLQKLREKYANDKEALNREMITMMRSHGYNPMAGCLPILVQMPIFFALYRVLYSSTELFHAPFYFWIHDLSSKDPLYITPILLTGVMYIQQKLTPNTATDPAQQKMLQFMPVIFGVFMLALPSGLTLYMLTNAVASIFQQMILNKKLNITPPQGARYGGANA